MLKKLFQERERLIKLNPFNEPLDLDIKGRRNKDIHFSVINQKSNFSANEVKYYHYKFTIK